MVISLGTSCECKYPYLNTFYILFSRMATQEQTRALISGGTNVTKHPF